MTKKKTKENLESVEEVVPEKEVAPEPVKPAVVVRKAAHTVPKSEPVMTFQRWFATLGKPAHHKAGMMAFTSTSGKRTPAAWNAAFKNY